MYLQGNVLVFNRSMYSVDENAGPVQPVLYLNTPLSETFMVEVYSTNGAATGKYCSILTNYLVILFGMTNML